MEEERKEGKKDGGMERKINSNTFLIVITNLNRYYYSILFVFIYK